MGGHMCHLNALDRLPRPGTAAHLPSRAPATPHELWAPNRQCGCAAQAAAAATQLAHPAPTPHPPSPLAIDDPQAPPARRPGRVCLRASEKNIGGPPCHGARQPSLRHAPHNPATPAATLCRRRPAVTTGVADRSTRGRPTPCGWRRRVAQGPRARAGDGVAGAARGVTHEGVSPARVPAAARVRRLGRFSTAGA